jgi:predicted nucleic acid-binding protein
MYQARLARSVLMDTSPVRRFTDAKLLAELMSYLPNAAVVAEVARELDDAAKSKKNELLAAAIANFGWPKRVAGISGPTQLAEATILVDILTKAEPNKSHLGEVATILRARQLKTELVIMDDKVARQRAARPRNVITIATATLVAEMTHHGALTTEQGWSVFQISTENTIYFHFEAALERAARTPTPFSTGSRQTPLA